MTIKFSNCQSEPAPHDLVRSVTQERVVEDASTNPINFPMHCFAGKGVRVTNAPSVENLT